jgi:hypothetical protein
VVRETRLVEAAKLFRASGAVWSELASRAGSAVPAASGSADPAALFDELAELVDEARSVEQRAIALVQGGGPF